jgi:hypothetical protein
LTRISYQSSDPIPASSRGTTLYKYTQNVPSRDETRSRTVSEINHRPNERRRTQPSVKFRCADAPHSPGTGRNSRPSQRLPIAHRSQVRAVGQEKRHWRKFRDWSSERRRERRMGKMEGDMGVGGYRGGSMRRRPSRCRCGRLA